jgi:hypothetical protein
MLSFSTFCSRLYQGLCASIEDKNLDLCLLKESATTVQYGGHAVFALAPVATDSVDVATVWPTTVRAETTQSSAWASNKVFMRAVNKCMGNLVDAASIVRKECVERWMRRARLMGLLLVFAGRPLVHVSDVNRRHGLCPGADNYHRTGRPHRTH